MSALQISPSVITLAIIHDSATPVKGFCFTNLFFSEFHKKRPKKHSSAGFCRLFRPLLFYLLLINRPYASIKTFLLSFYRFPDPLPHTHLGYMRNSGHFSIFFDQLRKIINRHTALPFFPHLFFPYDSIIL